MLRSGGKYYRINPKLSNFQIGFGGVAYCSWATSNSFPVGLVDY